MKISSGGALPTTKEELVPFCVRAASEVLCLLRGKTYTQIVQGETKMEINALVDEILEILIAEPELSEMVLEDDGLKQKILDGVANLGDQKTKSTLAFESGNKVEELQKVNGLLMRKARLTGTPCAFQQYLYKAGNALCTHGRKMGLDGWNNRCDLAMAMRIIEGLGMGTSIWGHATIRDPQDPSKMILATHGTTFGEACASIFTEVEQHPDRMRDRMHLYNDTAVVLHGACYATRPEVNCVLHTHMPYATAMACSKTKFDAGLIQDAMQFTNKIAYMPFGGVADDLSEMDHVNEAMKGGADILFLQNHGVIVAGPDVATAFSRLWYLERACEVQFLTAQQEVHRPDQTAWDYTGKWYARDGHVSAMGEWVAWRRECVQKAVDGGAGYKAFYE